jgi:hypothetical protein
VEANETENHFVGQIGKDGYVVKFQNFIVNANYGPMDVPGGFHDASIREFARKLSAALRLGVKLKSHTLAVSQAKNEAALNITPGIVQRQGGADKVTTTILNKVISNSTR